MDENKEMAEVIAALTEKLSAKQRIVFTLVCLEGLETAEIEALTGYVAEQRNSRFAAAKTGLRTMHCEI